MSTKGYLSSMDVSWSLGGLLMRFFFLDNQVSHREVRTGREDRLTDRRAKGGNGERRIVKSGALEVILAGNLSYHSDLVKALQQERGEREMERVRERERAEEQTLRYCVSLSWSFIF